MRPINDDFDQLPNLCAYCGASPAPTRDHVIPKAFRPEIDEAHDWILVRCCQDCNNKKSRLDGEARNHLSLYQDARGNVAADFFTKVKIPEKIKHLKANQRMSPTLAMLQSMKPKFGIDGTLIAMVGQQEVDLFSPWLEYVVKGLAVALTREQLLDAVFEVRAFTRDNFIAFLSSRQPFEYVVSLGNHTMFSVDPMGLGRGYGLRVFQFFGGLGFAVLAIPNAIANKVNDDAKGQS